MTRIGTCHTTYKIKILYEEDTKEVGDIINFTILEHYLVELIECSDRALNVKLASNAEHGDMRSLAAALCQTAMELYKQADAKT